uniref:Uncharacterized protein n=1 Tax=Physcomitrium patens TaxID=3218 RepID=A0A2K1IDM9_PHYPA|nr:hypothetical protein PHYPA_029540 [Physcomitrium patens]
MRRERRVGTVTVVPTTPLCRWGVGVGYGWMKFRCFAFHSLCMKGLCGVGCLKHALIPRDFVIIIIILIVQSPTFDNLLHFIMIVISFTNYVTEINFCRQYIMLKELC